MAGLVGPKPMPKGSGDGYQVNIPELHTDRYDDAGTHRDVRGPPMDWPTKRETLTLGKSGVIYGER